MADARNSRSFDADAGRARGRFFPAGWGRFVLALPLVAIPVVRFLDPAGDRGTVNAFTMMLLGLFVLLWLLWLLAASSLGWRGRLGVVGALVLAVGAFLAVFRFERVTGEMVPVFALRGSEKAMPLDQAPDPSRGTVIDLRTETEADFPQFLGPDRRAEVPNVRLDPDWQTHPPEELWRRPMGAGLSGFAVRNGHALTLEQRGADEVLTCYAVADGEPCWSWSYPGGYRSVVAGDGPRSTPTIDGGEVFLIGTFGLVAAVDGATGQPSWQRETDDLLGLELSDEERGKLLPYGRPGSPLVVDDLVVVPGGGTPEAGYVSLLALDRSTGREVWRGGDRQISCASPTIATLAGRRQILSVDEDRVAGYDPSDGRVLWSHPWPGRTSANASVSQPVPLPPDRVFVSKGYGQGSAVLRLSQSDSSAPGLSVEEVWHSARLLRTKFTNVVLHDGHAYGLSDGILECVDLATGERRWKKGRYQQGQVLGVGDHLLVLSESGELTLVAASPDQANQVLGSIQAVSGKTWNNPALFGDVLLVRNGVEAAAFRLKTL